MKFQYQYKLSGGERRAGVCEASSKDAVFVILKQKGIKPFDVKLAPGLFNKICSLGKRGLAIVILAAVTVVLSFMVFRPVSVSDLSNSFDAMTRRQVIGDPAVIDQGVRTGWADVFDLEGDRFLASFAIPGTIPAVRSTTEEKLQEAIGRSSSALDSSLEARQICAIVAGMKEEARQFLADGGTLAQYGRLLVGRQEQEIEYYNRARNEIEIAAQKGNAGALEELWTKRNQTLKKMGIKTVLFPEKTK